MSTPREVFTELTRHWSSGSLSFPQHLLADQVVVEMPLAPAGWPNRIEGKTQVIALAAAGAALPVRFDECRDLVMHDTADPEVVVAEYQLTGTITATGAPAAARFITVFRVRGGRITHWREYHNIAALVS